MASSAVSCRPEELKWIMMMSWPTTVWIHVHEQSVIETRQSKATTLEDNSLFLKRKRRAASGGTQTHDVLHTRQTCACALIALCNHDYHSKHTCTCIYKFEGPHGSERQYFSLVVLWEFKYRCSKAKYAEVSQSITREAL